MKNNFKSFKHQITILFLLLMVSVPSFGQDDLLDILEEDNSSQTTSVVTSIFKGTRLINGQSIETRSKGVLELIISHRFGTLNSGLRNLYGLDEANIRIGLDYSVTNNLTLGIGRSSYQKVIDGFLKYKLLTQREGAHSFPFTLVAYSNVSINTLEWPDPSRDYDFAHRNTYTNQLLFAKKFNRGLSLQVMPTVVHRNLVSRNVEDNLIFALGVGGRQKLTSRLAMTFEYYYQFNNESPNNYINALALGLDIETGGHVFQLHFTNARPTFERGFITETQGNLFKGDIHFGFNISRTFQLHK